MEVDLIDEEEDFTTNCESFDQKRPENIKFFKGNCPEHIIFALDVCKEDETSPFSLREGLQPPLELLKKALSLFMQNKSHMNPNHKYALILLQDIPYWKVNFTSDYQEILRHLDDIDEIKSPEKCDLAQIFDVIDQNSSSPLIEGNSAPLFVIRTILIYGRSQCLPQFLEGRETFLTMYQNPCFFLDIIYLHEQPSENNRCEKIYKLLCKLEEDNNGYVFDVGRNATNLFNFFGNLLAHPFQRPLQNNIHCTLEANAS